jgi:uncharacterized protein (DUF1800 family)
VAQRQQAAIPRRVPAGLLAAVVLAPVTLTAAPVVAPSATPAELALVNRVTWGVNQADAETIARLGADAWLDRQLHPAPGDHLPAAIKAEIDAGPGARTPLAALIVDLEASRAAAIAGAGTDPDRRNAAQQAYGKTLNDLYHQAAARSLLRDIYSPDQLREQMTWFWFNHFNVHAYKANLRAMVGDYEDTALRPYALGRFRDLLEATLRHPAMLRYLDNADNAVGHINENYAREIMELHTLGVGAGYGQKDVQELARILTGVGIDARATDPRIPPARQGQLVRAGLFEFNPNRHDYGDKIFLNHRIQGRGFGEVEQALDILAHHPATAHHISEQLAVYFVADTPPEALVQRMSQTFLHTDGDIAQVLRVMFRSPEFKASLGTKFKDPAHYVVSSIRLTYGDRPILNTSPAQQWLNRLGEGLYNHETPDGYPMSAAAWDGPGQLDTRFELARQIGSGPAGLFRPETPGAAEQPGYPQLQNALYFGGLSQALTPSTKGVLTQAASPQDWNTLFLSSPDFMRR